MKKPAAPMKITTQKLTIISLIIMSSEFLGQNYLNQMAPPVDRMLKRDGDARGACGGEE